MAIRKEACIPLFITQIQDNLRMEDRREMEHVNAALGKHCTVRDSVVRSWERGVLFDTRVGRPVLAYGVVPDETAEGYGVCWMMGTPLIQKNPLGILRFARREIESWMREFTTIYNFVDTRNELHVRWLQILGFTLGAKFPVNGVDFQFFFKSRR